jgi:serine/threonine-protein kinase HipA
MTDSLIVIIAGVVAGAISRLPGGKLEFSYEPRYTATIAATPLSLSMPLTTRPHPDHLITPWLWGLLPDDPAVIARWARHFDLARTSPFTLLATAIGADCAGAVQFARPDAVDKVMGRSGTITWLGNDDVADRLRELRRDSTSWLGTTSTGQFSLAGAQAKTALIYQDGCWAFHQAARPPRTSSAGDPWPCRSPPQRAPLPRRGTPRWNGHREDAGSPVR